MSKSLLIALCLVPALACATTVQNDALDAISSHVQPAKQVNTAANKTLKPNLLGLHANMTVKEVKALGVSLKPFIQYSPRTEHAVHAFYGMNSYTASNVPKTINDAGRYILTFNKKGKLKIIQVESKIFHDRRKLAKVNERVNELKATLEQSFGKAKVRYPRGIQYSMRKRMPIYRMQKDDIKVSISPVIKSYHRGKYETVYVVKYRVKG